MRLRAPAPEDKPIITRPPEPRYSFWRQLMASVRSRLLLALVAVFIVIVFILVSWSVADDLVRTERAHDQIGNIAARIQREMDRQLTGIGDTLERLSSDHTVALRDPVRCRELAVLAAGQYPGAGIWVLSLDGSLHCGSTDDPPSELRRRISAAAAAGSNELITEGEQAYLIRSYSEGVLAHSLSPVITPAAISGATAAVISDGRYLVHVPPIERSGQPLPSELLQSLTDTDFFTAIGPDGVERLYGAAQPVAGTDWQLLVGIPTELLAADRQGAIGRDLGLALGIAVIAGGVGLMLYRGVDAPLRQLQASASAATAADHRRISVVPGAPREVQVLGRSINQLLERAHSDRERLQAILATMPVFVFAADHRGVIRQVEGDPARLGNLDELLGVPISKISEQNPDLAPLFAAATEGQPVSTRLMIGGVMHTLHLRPLSEGGWAAIAVDQDEQHRTEMRLAAAESRLRTILEHLPAVVYTYELLADGQRRMLYVSSRAEEMLGYSTEELMRTDRRHLLVDPRDLARVQAEDARGERSGEPYSVECRFVRSDGQSIWVSDTEAQPIVEGDRRLVHGVILDIEARRSAEAALREERRRLHLLFSHAAVGVALVGRGGRLLVVNDAFERLTGVPASQMRRLAPRRWIHPDDRPRLASLMTTVGTGLAASGGVEVRTHPDLGAERWVRLTASGVPGDHEQGGLEQWVVIIEDVTEQHRMQIRLDQERQRLDELLNSIGDAFVALDEDLRLTYVNDAAQHILSRFNQNLLGQSLEEAFPGLIDRETEWHRLLQRAAVERIAGQTELEISPGVWFSLRFYPATDAGVSVFFNDVTEQHHAAQELMDSEERYRHLIEVSPETIAVHVEGMIAYVNPAGLKMMRIDSLDDVIGTPAIEWVDPRDRTRVIERITQLHEDGADGQIREERFLRRDGSIVTVEVTASTLTWEGKPAIQIVARDTSERRRLEAQVRQAQKMEVVGRLAGGVAHDLNNLLTGLRGYNELLLETLPSGSEPAEYASLVANAGKRASDMTRQLLSFARQYPADPSVIDVNVSIAEWLPMLRRLAGTQVETVHDAASDLPAVLIDKHQFEQAIFNLAVNARDAMPDGGQLTIRTSLAPPPPGADGDVAGEWVRVEVVDTGIGMNDEEVSRAFEPFWTTKAPGEGTGLGLSTVYGTVTQAGGLIEIDSAPGRGTNVSIWLMPSKETATVSLLEDPAPPAAAETARTILLVEDDETVRHIASVTLQRAGHRVLAAANAAKALLIWEGEEAPPDALVSDVMMPEVGGVELAKLLLERQPGLRVLMISGYAEDAGLPALIRAAGHSFLPKPFLPSELLTAVSELLRPPPAAAGDGKMNF